MVWTTIIVIYFGVTGILKVKKNTCPHKVSINITKENEKRPFEDIFTV